ncbi:MAG: NAD-dependent epimerase/dehydratase family protein [Candidatus Falkowbacteria bacterium]|nr:NAD-dependent epimerase/dehydratase family protein [Candidatus Falkowbacteria bacterium]
MSKYLVTGGAGFIGSTLVDQLIEKGHQVVVIDNLSGGDIKNINKKAEFFCVDIRDFDKISPYFEGVDYVMHLAGLISVQDSLNNPREYNDVNLVGMINVLEAARLARVKKLVFSSSAAVYGNPENFPTKETEPIDPLSPYALQKYIGERYCQLYSEAYGLATICLRYFNVYGNRMALSGGYGAVLGVFARQKLNQEPMTITGDGEQKRDFVSVLDIARANISAAENAFLTKGEAINIGTGQSFTINEIAGFMSGPVKNIPARVEPKLSLADNTKARVNLNWDPKENLADWIKEFIEKK